MKNFFIILIVYSFSSQAWSADDWYMKSSGQFLLKNYSSSLQLDNLTGFGIFLSGDYLERGGFSVGYSFNQTNYKSGLSSGLQENNENILFLSGRANLHPDQLPGKLTLRLDGYVGNSAMRFRVSTSSPGPMGGGSSLRSITVDDDFSVLSPMISFLNYTKTFYLDLGYAYSSYSSEDSSTDDIDVIQWTPTLGFGFNRAYDWLQLRGYFIELSSSNRIGDKDSTSALEVKWTHWFSADAPLSLHSLRFAALAGERMYAVDSDACSLCNVPDLQRGLVSVGAEWKLSEQTNAQLLAGYESYKSVLLNDDYSSAYLFGYLSRNW